MDIAILSMGAQSLFIRNMSIKMERMGLLIYKDFRRRAGNNELPFVQEGMTMIKYFCDRCGVEMTKEKRHGFVSVNTRDKAEGDLLEENEFESWLFCKKCTEDIRRYVRTLPLKPSQNDEKRDQNKEKCDQNEGKCDQNEGKRSESAESEAKPQETVSEEVEDESTTGKKKYDVGKIMALKKAGWKVKDIADEMKMTPQQVSNQIYLYNKKMQENGAETEVHMSRIEPTKRPKL